MSALLGKKTVFNISTCQVHKSQVLSLYIYLPSCSQQSNTQLVDSVKTINIRGSSPIFLQRFGISGRSIDLVRQTKVYQTQKYKKEKRTSTKFSNAPPSLAKIEHHPPHGGESPFSNRTFQEKRPYQQIMYPFGSALARAIFDW